MYDGPYGQNAQVTDFGSRCSFGLDPATFIVLDKLLKLFQNLRLGPIKAFLSREASMVTSRKLGILPNPMALNSLPCLDGLASVPGVV